MSYEGHTHTRWLVDTQEVGVVRAGVGRARREVLGDGSLLVTRAKLSDAGEYTCSASNKYGVMNATAFVTVLSECDISRDLRLRSTCKPFVLPFHNKVYAQPV